MVAAERLLAVLAMLWLLSCCACAATYHVGKGQPDPTMQQLLAAVTLGDHDVVLVHPGIYPALAIERGGGVSPSAGAARCPAKWRRGWR